MIMASKMHRTWRHIVLNRIIKAAFLILLLTMTVVAHPGRTDARGGHRDSSTDEYHYHHGYPAHQHTDLDGDGKADCPYDFDDKTRHDSGSSSGQTRVISEQPATGEKPTQRLSVWIYIFAAFVLWLLYQIIKALYAAAKVKAKKKAEDINSFNEAMKELNSIQKTTYNSEVYTVITKDELGCMLLELQEQLDSLLARKAAFDQSVRENAKELAAQHDALAIRQKNFSENYHDAFFSHIDKATPIPNGCFIGIDGLPHTTGDDRYTFYINKNSHIFHSKTCYHARNASPINAVNVDRTYLCPCSSCKPKADLSWYYSRMVYLNARREILSLMNCGEFKAISKPAPICNEQNTEQEVIPTVPHQLPKMNHARSQQMRQYGICVRPKKMRK